MAKFRFHWGWAIGVFYSLFVIALLIVVIKSLTVDNSLVVDNYYDYDIAYQQHADKLANTRALKQDVQFDHDRKGKVLSILFPDGFREYTGNILFYKPDNKKLDFDVAVQPDTTHIQKVDLAPLVEGYWRIKINWEGDQTAFYKEYSIYN